MKLIQMVKQFLLPEIDKLLNDKEFITEIAGTIEANLFHDVENRRKMVDILRGEMEDPEKLLVIFEKTQSILERLR